MLTYPKDWTEISLGDFAEVTKLAGFEFTEHVIYSDIGKIVAIRGLNVKQGKLVLDDVKFIDKSNFAKLSRSKLYINDILFTYVGTVGELAIIPENDRFFLAPNVARIRIKDKQDPAFVMRYMMSSHFFDEVITPLIATSSQPALSMGNIRKFVLRLPKVQEQKAIATTLNVLDEHLFNLSELIEKKKDIRDGALEDLISGRTRLKGFSGEWITVPFDKYFSLLKNNTYARDQLSEHGTIGNIHYGDVLIKYGDVVSDNDDIPFLKSDVGYSEKWLLQEKDVIIADTAEDETVGKAIQVGKISYPLVGGLHTIVCRPNYDTATGFLGYYINSKEYHDQLLPHITGIKVSSISKKAIKTTEIKVPKDVKEQAAIAEVLASMDSEISALEEKREKMIQIREGAMDDLLTGKVRLSE